MKFSDIKPFTRCSSYCVTVPWSHLERHIERAMEMNLDLDPDFQRAHVWTPEKQIRYVEYILRQGHSSRELWFNHTQWNGNPTKGRYEIVDGKQRLQAARMFLANQIPAFGYHYEEYEDPLRFTVAYFNWHVNDLKTREEVLQFYLDLNEGGVVHTEEELSRVRALLEAEKK